MRDRHRVTEAQERAALEVARKEVRERIEGRLQWCEARVKVNAEVEGNVKRGCWENAGRYEAVRGSESGRVVSVHMDVLQAYAYTFKLALIEPMHVYRCAYLCTHA